MQERLLGGVVAVLGLGAAYYGARGERGDFHPGLSELLLSKVPVRVWRVVMMAIGGFVFAFGLIFALGVLA